MIKVVNFYNHCDVNRELCSIYSPFFWWWLHPFPRGGIEYKQYSSSEKCNQTLSMQHVSKHSNPWFKILSLDLGKGTTNGLFVGRIDSENVRCMESQDEKKCNFCGLKQSRIYFHEEKCWIQNYFSNTQ
jgi:hypothetical protein